MDGDFQVWKVWKAQNYDFNIIEKLLRELKKLCFNENHTISKSFEITAKKNGKNTDEKIWTLFYVMPHQNDEII